jgi:hypothetical protein
MGKQDEIYWSKAEKVYFVKDDYGKHIMFDATFVDMVDLEEEIMRTASLYITRTEPLLDEDLRTCYPAVDRLRVAEAIMKLELEF